MIWSLNRFLFLSTSICKTEKKWFPGKGVVISHLSKVGMLTIHTDENGLDLWETGSMWQQIYLIPLSDL